MGEVYAGTCELERGGELGLGKEVVGKILDAGYNLGFFDDPMLEKVWEGGFGETGVWLEKYRVVVLAGVERIPAGDDAEVGGVLRAGRE